MKIKFAIVAILLLQLICFIGKAQNNDLKFTLVEGDNGKPLGKITGIAQSPDGYMWFCGQDERCLYRYDGNKVISFRHDEADSNSLGPPTLETIYADKDGMIWIGGDGLDKFDPATGIFKHYRHIKNDPGSLSAGAMAILKDSHGRLWVASGGLDQLDEKTGKFIHYRNVPGNQRSLSSNVVRSIYEDHRGTIWVGTGLPFIPDEDGGLNRLDPDGKFTRYMHDPNDPHSLINNKVKAMFEDSRGIFWVGTAGDGLHTMDREKGSFERHLYNPAKPGLLSRPKVKGSWDHITFINEDNAGAIWIGSYTSGINRYDTVTKKITHYESGNEFPDSSSWNGFISQDGVLWICTEWSHLLFKATPPNTIPSFSAVSGSNCFLEDKEGFLWVGTTEQGLMQYDKQKKLIHQFNPLPSNNKDQPKNSLHALLQDQQDTIWIGTDNGVETFDKRTQQFSRFSLGFEFKKPDGGNIYSIFRDKEGTKWFATGEGIVSYNQATGIKRYQPNDKDTGAIGSNRIISFLEDRSGEFWVGVLDAGIDRLNRKTGLFRHYLPGRNGICMYQDSRGIICTGTSRGLYQYNKKEDRFDAVFASRPEISNHYIYGIVEDEQKALWICTPSAIIKIDPEKNETFMYGSRYSITPFSIRPNAFYKTAKGQLLFGNDNGFYAFFPEELAVKTNFKIILTDFFINTLPVLPGKGGPLQKPVDNISDINLKYNQNNIAFNFIAIDHKDPKAVKYFTMLENYDNTWREVVGEKSSYYFNVSPGKYVFRVKAFNINGTKTERAITIYIDPPWWKTWWAYLLYALLIILGASIFISWRTKALKKEKIMLEEKVAERTKELKEEKEIVESTLSELKATQTQLIQSEKMASLGELTAGIAHEIQNPLNFVNNFSEVNKELLLEMTEEIDKENYNEVKAIAKDIRENEEKINHHGKRADAIVKGMLQHSRSSTGIKESTNINALADEYLRLSYHGLRAKDKSFNATLKTDLDESIDNINIIPQDIGRVLLNLFNNAFYAVDEKQKAESLKPKAEGKAYEPVVLVSTKKISGKVEVRVSDNGNGIPQKILDKIFQPFFTTKPTGQGTGLGLSLSYDIIKTHGGEIRVESKEGKGTIIYIDLPV